MASKTTNYNLDMPGYNEVADIDVINGNMDKIDVQMKNNADSAQQSKDIVSDKYSATNTYAVGDYCIRENVLYKCKTAITTGEEFDSNKWVQTTCGTEFKELNSNLDTLSYGENSGSANLFDKSKIVRDAGIGVSGQPYGYKGFGYSDYIHVEPNTEYTFMNVSWYNYYDANKSNISQSTGGTSTTPSNAKYVIVSFQLYVVNSVMVAKFHQTEYVPYVISNKQLTQANESLEDYGLVNVFDGNMIQGNYQTSDGLWSSNAYGICSANSYPCKAGNKITLKYAESVSNLSIRYYNGSSYISGENFTNVSEFTTTAPANTTNFKINIIKESNFTPNQACHIGVYVNNAIDNLKNDLGGLSFSVSGTTLSITDGTNTWTLPQ